MDVYIKAAEILNRIADALNSSNHIEVQRLLINFDKTPNNNRLPLDFAYRRVWAEAELSARIGDYLRGINVIASHLSMFENDTEMIFRLLLKAGKLECLSSRRGVSSHYLIDALGLAEENGNKQLIAKAYEAIGQMFSLCYPGLAIYFLRKSEMIFAELEAVSSSELCRMERALLYIIIVRTRNIPEDKKKRLVYEAKNIVSQYKEDGLNPHEIRHFRYIKAFVNGDREALLELLKALEGIEALPDKCRYEDMYIGFCVETGLWDEAKLMFEQYRQDIIALHGDSEETVLHLNNQLSIIEQEIPAVFVPHHAIRGNDEHTTLFDILDHYSFQDELWALDRGTFRLMFPSYAQEGKFEAIRMPDGTTRLYPMGLAYNVYYRGQSEHYDNSYPTLYRKGITPAKRFVERIKLEELRKCVEDYPITNLFKDGFYITFRDGSFEKVELAVDVTALAQHYGVCTELMDLTTDKFVAAFFATTKYANGHYTPITEKQDKPGVFYRYSESIPNYTTLCAVGLQPFSRPGEQSGLVYKMKEDQNFNDVVISSDYFEHSPEVSHFIFNYTNRSKKLFPSDPLTVHAEQIVKSKVFSYEAYEKAKENFYKEVPENILRSYLDEEHVELSDNIDFLFTEEEKTACIDAWNNGGLDKTLSQIFVRPIYTGPIVFQDEQPR